MTFHLAIVGSGPAGYYTAEAAQKALGDGVRVDIIDRLAVPFGLIRSGVAPDHQSIKNVARRYEAVALSDTVRFVGNVTVGRDVTIAELRARYDAVVLATGAPADRPLDIPGADLPGVVGSAAFVGWYNGHPDFAGLAPPLDGDAAVVIGNGNVALDIARVLAKTEAEFAGSDIVGHALAALRTSAVRSITLLGRRGPHQIAMTPKELSELAHLARAIPFVDAGDLPDPALDADLDPGLRKSVTLLRDFAAADRKAAVRITFDFYARPVAIEGDGRAERIVIERTRLDEQGAAIGTGETYTLPARLVVSAIGYRTPPIDGVPYDARAGRFANDGGRIDNGLYAVGWARRGPSGTIGTNRPDGYTIAARIADEVVANAAHGGGNALDTLLADRDVDVVTFRDWQRIDAGEVARARTGNPREKFVSLTDMLDARDT